MSAMRKSQTLRGSTNSLLSKVNSQLKGTYVHKPIVNNDADLFITDSDLSQESDGVEAYLNNLNKRASKSTTNIEPKTVAPAKSFMKSKFLKKSSISDKSNVTDKVLKSISMVEDSEDSDLSFDESIANNLRQDRAKLKSLKSISVEEIDSMSEDDINKYINALSDSTIISMKLEAHQEKSNRFSNINTETNNYTEIISESNQSDLDTESIDEIIESNRLNSPYVSRKFFVDLRSPSNLSKRLMSRSPSPLRSCLTTSRPLTPKSQLNRVVTLDDDVTEIIETRVEDITTATGAVTRNYSDDFDDGSISVCSTNRTDYSYTSSTSTLTSQRSSSTSASKSRRSRRARRHDSSITSQQTTESDTSRSTISSRRDRHHRKYKYKKSTEESLSDQSSIRESNRKKKTMKSTSVQTMPEEIDSNQHWNKTKLFTKTTPIARYVVNVDALNALLAHNPSEIAMNDMLAMQLSLTEEFIEAQKNLHRNMLSSIEGSGYHYTTLDDVKQYIKKHRKPRLSFKDALKQVKKEMGIK